MNIEQAAVARTCLTAAHDRSLSFPEIVARLIGAGFEGYAVDYRRNTTIYFHDSGASVALENPAPVASVAARFDALGVAEQIKWAQANRPDYSYAAFSRNVAAAGCAGYLVSFPGRRVVYYGRTAELHVEHFPQ
jgi:uncharacterized protein YbcV (DUF1398 family)